MLSDEDRSAFHRQADRVLDSVDVDFNEVDRQDKNNAVRSVLMTLKDGESIMVVLKIAPRHRFIVDLVGGSRENPGGDYFRTTRRDDAAEKVENFLS